MHKYRLVAKKGEGTFSEVLKAQCIKNGVPSTCPDGLRTH
jgi:hypothetical protein